MRKKSYGKKRILEEGGMRLLRNIEKKAVTVHIRGLVNELIQILITPDENIHYGNIGQEFQNQSHLKREGTGQKSIKMTASIINRTSSPILREDETRTSFRTISSPHNIHIRRSPERIRKKPQGDFLISNLKRLIIKGLHMFPILLFHLNMSI